MRHAMRLASRFVAVFLPLLLSACAATQSPRGFVLVNPGSEEYDPGQSDTMIAAVWAPPGSDVEYELQGGFHGKNHLYFFLGFLPFPPMGIDFTPNGRTTIQTLIYSAHDKGVVDWSTLELIDPPPASGSVLTIRSLRDVAPTSSSGRVERRGPGKLRSSALKHVAWLQLDGFESPPDTLRFVGPVIRRGEERDGPHEFTLVWKEYSKRYRMYP